jgi:hypothetical protein
MQEQISILNEAIEFIKSETSWQMGDVSWVKFRGGRNPPVCSVLGALLIKNNRDSYGNFMIPNSGAWKALAAKYLNVSYDYVELFERGLEEEKLSSMWCDNDIYMLGRNYKNVK